MMGGMLVELPMASTWLTSAMSSWRIRGALFGLLLCCAVWLVVVEIVNLKKTLARAVHYPPPPVWPADRRE